MDSHRFSLPFIAFLIFSVFSFPCFSQVTISKFRVMNEKAEGLPSSTITLLKDSISIYNTVTDSAGFFTLPQQLDADMMVITHSGYQEQRLLKPFKFELNVIQLVPAGHTLDAVTIAAKQNLVEADAGTITYHVSKSIDAQGMTALEVLKKAPGVFVLNDNTVTLNGKAGVQIMLDGKLTYLSGQELTDLLKTLPASGIKSIEIIANPSAKYDAAGSAGIINIKTNKIIIKGFSGSSTTGVSYGVSVKNNQDLSFSYRHNNFALFGSYNHFVGHYNYLYGSDRLQNTRTYRSATNDTDKRNRVGARIGLDYYLNKKNTIGFLINANYVIGGGITQTRTDISKPASLLTDQVLYAENDYYYQHTSRYIINLNYRFEDASGRILNADVDYGWFNKDNGNMQKNLYTDAQNIKMTENLYHSLNAITIPLKVVKIDYTTPLWKGVLETGVKGSAIESGNAARFYHVLQSGDSLDTRRSNRFSFREKIGAAYLNYKTTRGKWVLQGGVRLEQSISTGKLYFEKNGTDTIQENTREQLKVFPSFSISYKPSDRHAYSLSYSKRIDRPAYQDLNPFVYLLDELSFWQGNPFLQPQLTHRTSLQYLYKSATIIGLHFSHTDAYSTRITDTIDGNKIVMIPRNLGVQQNFSLTLTQNLTVNKWWELSLNGTLYHLENKIALDQQRKLNLSQTAARGSVQQRFKLPLSIAAELSAYYNSRRLVGANEILRATSQVDIAFSKNLLNKRAVIRLAFNDIYKGTRTRSEQRFEGFYMRSYGYYETRQVRINFTYRLEGKNAKAPRNRSSASENENSRIRN